MSRKFLLWAMAFVVICPTLFGVGYWVYWNQFQRYAPVTIDDPEDLPKIQALLDHVDYLSPDYQKPGLTPAAAPLAAKKAVYLITFRACTACRDYERDEFPRLQAAHIETRVVVFARADNQGTKQSTPEERSTVAELWLNRSWPLYQQWRATPDENWPADHIPVADNDLARSGVVWASRDFVNQLGPLLRHNKVSVGYPLIIWRDKQNQLRVCNCNSAKAWHFIREDLGVPGDLERDVKGLLHLPDMRLPGSEQASSPAALAPQPVPEPSPAPGLNYGPDSAGL